VIDNDTRASLDALLSSGFGGRDCGMAKPPMNWMLVASEIQRKSNGFKVFTNIMLQVGGGTLTES
jgi:hypothetical protein